MRTVIANWKANPTTLEEARELFDFSVSEAVKYPNLQVVICPPFVYLEELAKRLHQFQIPKLGAQDFISTDMLKNFGVTHVLVGHSDRRYKIGETDEVINKKVKAALAIDIVPVLLVGERNRDDDRRQVLETQLGADLVGLTAEQVSKVLITYEPVWAISTQPDAQPDTPESVLEAVKIIQEFIAKTYNLKPITCLYGGSVNSKNVSDFLKHSEISGAVIGGASLRKEEFTEILKIISNL